MSLAAFAATWRYTTVLGIVLIVVALLLGLFSSGAAPAWVFAVGAIFLVAGIAAFLVGLSIKARDVIEDVLDGDDDPAGPTGPKIERPESARKDL